MPNREKVIKAAEICLRYIDDGDCPTECPYFDLCTKYEKRVVFQPLIRDALALLKEQDDMSKELTDAMELVHKKNDRIKKLEEQIETLTKWRMNAGAFD